MSLKLTKRQHAVNLDREDPRTPAGDALSWLVFQILQLNGLLTNVGDALAAPAGQTSARWQVLAAVEDVPLSVAQIARALNLTRQSVQRVADLLVQDKLALYVDNPAHARAKLLRLQPKGHAALETIQAGQRAWANAIAERIDEGKLRKASAVLAELHELVAAPESPQGD
jgi:DNA-binding MarR family transcriptional regulator